VEQVWQGLLVIDWDEDGVSVSGLCFPIRCILQLIMLTAIIIGCIIYLVGGALQTGAANLNYLWAGRWLAGLGVGFLVMIVPIYQYVYTGRHSLLDSRNRLSSKSDYRTQVWNTKRCD
jgi:MFS family permease